MHIQFEASPIDKIAADALAVICFEADEIKSAEAPAVAPPSTPDPEIAAQSGWLAELRATGEFTGKLYELSILHRPEGLAAKRLIVVGGGKRDKFTTVEARRIGGTLVRAMKGKGTRTIALSLDGHDSPDLITAVVEGAALGAWEADKYKSDPKKNEAQIDSFTVALSTDTSGAISEAVRRGEIVAESQNFTRNLVNEPANKLTPGVLAEAAKQMATELGLEYEALDQDAMAKLGMGALLGVAQGSSNPPFLIVIKYRPALATSEDHLALVGKGVTFDTGGISIKPSDGMEKMKYDMAGAAAVLGAMKAIAQLKPAIPVTAYVPTVENMLNGNAQRPGDIVTSLAGKTIEVLNTDAEGRLILADAITYAIRNGATHIVDAATLTGAIGIALGHYNIGAFTNNQPFVDRFLAVSRIAGEKTWQMPMDEEYKDYLKSAFADLPNIGGRYGGSITAAWFLREFADPTPWVHLDIASTAWLDEPKPWLSKGPTGVAVRSFVQLATDWNRS
ncbi:MAG: leucyl aminopeptidase [Acidobacteriaceae bacterium]|nr:leucyl aminopeptidase [Acidobacteriaceae bacterium]MBV9294256.1 leucyl aminopeptidase [Acidobacteriaceae bacterium]MBV9765016.1 leucyl aminopeptidase [Acidobacteriaceae bacterium]